MKRLPARPVPTGPVDDRHVVVIKMIGHTFEVIPIRQVEAVVIHFRFAAAEDGYAVVLLIATQPNQGVVLQPVRDAEAEAIGIEGHRSM